MILVDPSIWIDREERPVGDARVYYVRTASPLWDVVRTAAITVQNL